MEVERTKVDTSSIQTCELPVIWVLGGPGSGKGTQCEYMSRMKEYVHISSGELLRTEVGLGTTRGRQIYATMEAGEHVPTAVIIDLLAETMVNKLNEPFPSPGGKAKGFLLDAFPYKLEQAEQFEERFVEPSKIIYLSLEQDVMIDRLLKRGNFDDNREAIIKRCATFQEKCRPVLEKYKDKVIKVDASEPAFIVTADITSALMDAGL